MAISLNVSMQSHEFFATETANFLCTAYSSGCLKNSVVNDKTHTADKFSGRLFLKEWHPKLFLHPLKFLEDIYFHSPNFADVNPRNIILQNVYFMNL